MSPASETVTFIVNWLSLGSLYALMALGLVIVYGILRLVNFAYGELIMVAGYTLYLLGGGPLPWLVMAAVAVAAAVVTSYLTERVAFRPVREKSLTAMLITSFAVSTLLQNAALLFVSPRARVVPLPDLFPTALRSVGRSCRYATCSPSSSASRCWPCSASSCARRSLASRSAPLPTSSP